MRTHFKALPGASLNMGKAAWECIKSNGKSQSDAGQYSSPEKLTKLRLVLKKLREASKSDDTSFAYDIVVEIYEKLNDDFVNFGELFGDYTPGAADVGKDEGLDSALELKQLACEIFEAFMDCCEVVLEEHQPSITTAFMIRLKNCVAANPTPEWEPAEGDDDDLTVHDVLDWLQVVLEFACSCQPRDPLINDAYEARSYMKKLAEIPELKKGDREPTQDILTLWSGIWVRFLNRATILQERQRTGQTSRKKDLPHLRNFITAIYNLPLKQSILDWILYSSRDGGVPSENFTMMLCSYEATLPPETPGIVLSLQAVSEFYHASMEIDKGRWRGGLTTTAKLLERASTAISRGEVAIQWSKFYPDLEKRMEIMKVAWSEDLKKLYREIKRGTASCNTFVIRNVKVEEAIQTWNFDAFPSIITKETTPEADALASKVIGAGTKRLSWRSQVTTMKMQSGFFTWAPAESLSIINEFKETFDRSDTKIHTAARLMSLMMIASTLHGKAVADELPKNLISMQSMGVTREELPPEIVQRFPEALVKRKASDASGVCTATGPASSAGASQSSSSDSLSVAAPAAPGKRRRHSAKLSEA